MVVGFTTNYAVPITTNVVSSNLTHGEVYSIQHYVIKFVNDLWQVSRFLQVLRFPPSIKLIVKSQYNGNIVESGIKHYNPNVVVLIVW